MRDIRIDDAEVVALSGLDMHPALVETGSTQDVVCGAILEVTPKELVDADVYERRTFHRISVVLESGTRAWAYVPSS